MQRNPNFYKKNPEKKLENIIGSFSTVDDTELGLAANLTFSGDDTTWRLAGDDCHNQAAEDFPLSSLGGRKELAPAGSRSKSCPHDHWIQKTDSCLLSWMCC
jgi:hypothetical protein